MKRALRTAFFWAAALVAVPLAGQDKGSPIPQPRLDSILPAGARAGSTAPVRISGNDLAGADRLIFSHSGLSAEPIVSPADRFFPEPRRLENAFRVTVKPGVPPGLYEVRAAGHYGLSNARRFVVGDREERIEKEPNNDPAGAEALALESALSGACDAQNLDHFRFAVKKGQRLIVDAMALRIDSRAQLVLTLLDGTGRERARSTGTRFSDPFLDYTPGEDGDCMLRVHDLTYRGGDAYAYRIVVTADPWIDFADPPVLRSGASNDVILYGRNLPGGAPSEVQIDGVRLDRLAVKIPGPVTDPAQSDPPGEALLRPADVSADFVTWRLGRSNPVRFLVSRDPVVRAEEADADPPALTLPVQVAGRFQTARDRDVFLFDAKKGEKIWVEVFSQRLGHPADPVLLVQRAATEKGAASYKDVQETDDQPTPMAAMQNNMEKRYRLGPEDPAHLLAVSEDGRYRVVVRDLFGALAADPRLAYVVAIRQARPDFRLVALPLENFPGDNKVGALATVLRRGGAGRIRIFAIRREGFEGEIRTEAAGLPAGVTARPLVLRPDQSSGDIILAAAPDAPAFSGGIAVTGRAEIDGRAVTRPARAAEVVWDAATQNEGLALRVTGSVGLGVDDRTPSPLGISAGGEAEIRAPIGAKLRIPVTLVKNAEVKDLDKAQVKLSAVGLPGAKNNAKAMAAMKDVTLTLAKPQAELEIDVTDKMPLGPLTFYVSGEVQFPLLRPAERTKQADRKRIEEVARQIAAELKEAEKALQKRTEEAQAAAKAITEAKEGEARRDAEGRARAAEEERAKAEAVAAGARSLAQAAEAHMKSLGEEPKKADAPKPMNVKAWLASLPVTIEVIRHPVTLRLDGAEVLVPAGGRADVAVAVSRECGGIAEVSLEVIPAKDAPLLRGGPPVALSGGGTLAEVSLSADPAMKPGRYKAVLRARVRIHGSTLDVEQPLDVRIEP